jgi:hypothetical protein
LPKDRATAQSVLPWALAVLNPSFGDQTLVITSLRQDNLSQYCSHDFETPFFALLAMRLVLSMNPDSFEVWKYLINFIKNAIDDNRQLKLSL